MNKYIRVTMPNGERWDVPTESVAKNIAKHYGSGFRPGVDDADDEILDWAAGNMDWSDVSTVAVKVADRPRLSDREFQEGWVNGEKEIVTHE